MLYVIKMLQIVRHLKHDLILGTVFFSLSQGRVNSTGKKRNDGGFEIENGEKKRCSCSS